MNNDYNLHDEEHIDALDHLIFRELGRQQQIRQQMQQWDSRKRLQLRYRILPVISNIASVAALYIMGLVLQAMLPSANVSTAVAPPTITNISDSTQAQTDSLLIQE